MSPCHYSENGGAQTLLHEEVSDTLEQRIRAEFGPWDSQAILNTIDGAIAPHALRLAAEAMNEIFNRLRETKSGTYLANALGLIVGETLSEIGGRLGCSRQAVAQATERYRSFVGDFAVTKNGYTSTPPFDGWISVIEAAQLFKVSTESLRLAIRGGDLNAERGVSPRGNRTKKQFVDPSAVEEWKHRRELDAATEEFSKPRRMLG